MLPIKRPLCKYFSIGICKNADSCAYSHEVRPDTNDQIDAGQQAASLDISKLSINSSLVSNHVKGAMATQTCKFFIQGSCSRGEQCWYIHPQGGLPLQRAVSATEHPHHHVDLSSKEISDLKRDSRGQVPCKFLSRPKGCQNNSCPYLHETVLSASVKTEYGRDHEANDDVSIQYSNS
jgi:hypothetical protein